MTFDRDKSFDQSFNNIPHLKWYPYIGPNFHKDGNRLMVFAHNMAANKNNVAESLKKSEAPGYWADSIYQYIYWKAPWTKAPRAFIKGSLGLKKDFGEESEASVRERVNTFVNQIAYVNFIQDVVVSDTPMTEGTPEQIRVSKTINKEILNILKVTHCIAWGKPTYGYIKNIEGYRVKSERSEGKAGFSSCVIDTGDFEFKLLKVFHPSMPSFSPFSVKTHQIISGFLA